MPSVGVDLRTGKGGQAQRTASPVVHEARQSAHYLPIGALARRRPRRNMRSLFNSRGGFNDISLARHEFARSTMTFGGNRNLDRALGRVEPGQILLSDYLHLYQRGGIAGMLVDKLVNTALRSGANILEGDGTENRSSISRWESDVDMLFDRLHAWEVLREAFIESRKGRFAIILIGAATAGGTAAELSEPLESVPGGIDGISFLRAYGESDMTSPHHDLIEDQSSPLFGFPRFYNVRLHRNKGTRKIHHTRAIHIANSLTPWGTPILERVFDDLQDKDKVVGGMAEGVFQNIKRRVWNIDPDVDFEAGEQVGEGGDIDFEDKAQSLEDSLAAFDHGLTDSLALRGVTSVDLKVQIPQVADNAKLIQRNIAAASGYPERVLFGTEEGKLAGEQDSAAYADDVKGYRENFCTRHVRQLIDRFMMIAALQEVAQYTVSWKGAEKHSMLDKAEITTKIANANKRQMEATGEPIIDVDEVRRDVWGYGESKQTPVTAALSACAVDDSAPDEVLILDTVINDHESALTTLLIDAHNSAGNVSDSVDLIANAASTADEYGRILDDGLEAILLGAFVDGAESSLDTAKDDNSFLRAATVAYRHLQDIELTFDATNSRVGDSVSRAATIVSDLTDDMRRGLNNAIAQGTQLGYSTDRIAGLIDGIVGLDNQQIDNVFSLAGKMARAEIGDKIKYGASEIIVDGTQRQIDRTVNAYIDSQQLVRNKRLARSLLSQSVNEGIRELQIQAQEAGMLPTGTVRVYIHNTTRHIDRSGQTVAVGESFEVEPGADVNCECASGLQVQS